MKSALEVIIQSDGYLLSHDRDARVEVVKGRDADVGDALTRFCGKYQIASNSVNIFISEGQVQVTALELPGKTPDIAEAVSFQLGAISPFPVDDVLYSYTSERREDDYRVIVFSARAGSCSIAVEELLEAGFVVKGLYPESQRYLTGKWKRLRWALVLPGKLTRILVFQGYDLEDTLLTPTELAAGRLTELCGTDNLFRVGSDVVEGFRPIEQLLAGSPVLRDYNLLPESYRRPDYGKGLIIFLLVLNLLGLAVVIGLGFFAQNRAITNADLEISRLRPRVQAVKGLADEVERAELFLDKAREIGGNPDIIGLLERLTELMPQSSFLDQLRVNPGDDTVILQGYTDDVGGLTEKLQEIGGVRLKSTSRRKKRTYFQMELRPE